MSFLLSRKNHSCHSNTLSLNNRVEESLKQKDRLVKRKIVGKKFRAFTITELMISVIVISIFAAFGLPNFQKAIVKNRERKAIVYLTTIQGANEIYAAKHAGDYLPDGGGLDLAGINAGFSINLFDGDVTYAYVRPTATTYTATADWAGTYPFTIAVDQDSITATNPCCASGAGTCRVAPVTAPCP